MSRGGDSIMSRVCMKKVGGISMTGVDASWAPVVKAPTALVGLRY
jgi:hypothetical protein